MITQRLRTDLGRSVGVTAVTPLVWLNQFTSAQPTHRKSIVINCIWLDRNMDIINRLYKDGNILKANQDSNKTLLYNMY